jgi:hypothetical protein
MMVLSAAFSTLGLIILRYCTKSQDFDNSAGDKYKETEKLYNFSKFPSTKVRIALKTLLGRL